MTRLFDQAIARTKLLPEADQETIGSIILQLLDSEQRWDELFSRPESADMLARMADKALADHRAGRSRSIDAGRE